MDDFSIKMNRTLAADLRFSPIDLANDQVWEFSGSNGEPPALAVQTTYGLRSRGMRIFPRFTLHGTTLTDPRTFFRAGKIEKRLSNYLLLTCSPFSSVDVELEYWVPSSVSICGRARVLNSGADSLTLNCDWAVLLRPQGDGEAMTSAEMGINTVLKGATEELFPVFFLTGGPQPSTKAYPALTLEMTLAPGAERRVSWSLASLDSQEASFILARQNTALMWETELVRQEMEAKRKTICFHSADAAIDDLLYESQIRAYQCLIQGPAPAKRVVLLPRRLPDTPLAAYDFSLRNKQAHLPATVYDLWQISCILLPAEPGIFKDLVAGYIDSQQPDGAIPWAVMPNGMASKAMLPPLLAGIARDVNVYLQEEAWLAQIYAPLMDAFKAWFPATSVWPAWGHLLQTGLDNSPLYSVWSAGDQGVDLSYIDSPALGAMLYRECQALIQIGQSLNQQEDLVWLQTKSNEIREHVLAGWNDQQVSFRYRDLATNECLPAEQLYMGSKNGIFKPKLDCKGQRRLLVTCIRLEGYPGMAEVILHGKNSGSTIDETIHFSPGQFHDGIARVTSSKVFDKINQIEISGLRKNDEIKIALAGFDDEDISLLLPLWAGIPSAEQAQKLVEKTLIPRYLGKFGLSCLPNDRYPNHPHMVAPLWNALIAEGLLKYGMRDQAARIIQACLSGLAVQWHTSGKLNDAIRVDDASGLGNQDDVNSLAMLLPFLRSLGIERILEKEIIFNGLNEYLAPFTVQYGRVEMQLHQDCTTITTLNGSKMEIHEAGMQKSVLP